MKGFVYCISQPLSRYEAHFLTEVTELKVPVYLLLGHHDYNCSWELGEKWLKQLKAPQKELVWFENSAHSPQWEEPELWNKEFSRIILNLNTCPTHYNT